MALHTFTRQAGGETILSTDINELQQAIEEIDSLGPFYSLPATPKWVTARYYDAASAISCSLSTGTYTANILRASLLYVPYPTTVDRIAIPVSSTAAFSARLGIYNMGADGNPGSLLLDAGTVSLAVTSTVQTITISQALAGRSWYWLASVTNGTTGNIIRLVPEASPLGVADLLSAVNLTASVEKAFTYAALPDPFGTPTITLGHFPRLGVRAT